ncbi:MAG: hypothetical protein HQM13_07490 [SAR324 cluster bacterium]|nr:hypothetical protein [SAR324 cluster bacterium]
MSTLYLLSIHPECIEGIQLSKRNERLSIKSEHSSAFIPSESGMNGIEKIGNFLEAHKWEDQAIGFIIPTEEVSFRTIHLPFQDKKKIQQTLPFEIRNEVLDDVEESYQYTTEMLADGTANVFLSLVPEPYLEALIGLSNEHDLSIRSIDCAAHLLFKSSPLHKDEKLQFQIYLGAEETFINVIEEEHLKSVKIFPNRIPQFLGEYPDLRKLELAQLHETIAVSPRLSEDMEVNKGTVEYAASLLKAEIEGLCAQFNFFLKAWQLQDNIQVSLHGLFGTLIDWDSRNFSFKTGNQEEKIDAKAVAADRDRSAGKAAKVVEDTMIDSREIGLADDDSDIVSEEEGESAEKNTEKTTWNLQELPEHSKSKSISSKSRIFSHQESAEYLSSFSAHWGILGELKKYDLSHLEGSGHSFYSEGTPFKRFVQKHRLITFMAILFLVLSLGSFSANQYLQLELLEKEIELTDRKLQSKLKQLLPDGSSSVEAAILQLQNGVQQKREDQREKRFNARTYNKIRFLEKLSNLLPENAPFIIRQLEYSQNRFSIKGAVDSYENLQILKSGLAGFEEFKDKNIVETNSSNPKGIFFTISINH